MNKKYRQASFLISAAKLDQTPPDIGFEVAFAGRSNAGKSSAINAICDNKSLARTSKTPGRTQLLNFFSIDNDRRLVDLPGYGYAKVAQDIKQEWQGALADYLEKRECLRGVVLMMDSRNPLKPHDVQMLDWANHIGLPVHIILTKADKLKKKEMDAVLEKVTEYISAINVEFSAQLFTALKKRGIDEAHAKLDDWFAMRTEE